MTRLWRVTEGGLAELATVQLQKESDLEAWIAKDPTMLGLDVLIIGRQVQTRHGGRIDLLGLDREGAVWVIECKRDQTPREVIAQIFDYAASVREMTDPDLHAIAQDYLKKPLPTAFEEWAGEALPESLNTTRNLVVAATEFDASSKRIIEYLAEEYGVSINAVFFRMFSDEGQRFLASDWLLEAEEVVERSLAKAKVPWTGYWFVNVASHPNRNWEDNRELGFISAGAGRWAAQLEKLKVSAPFYAYAKSHGYVGFGRIRSAAIPIAQFTLPNGKRLDQVKLRTPALLDNMHDPEKCEYVAAVDWIKTVPLQDAVAYGMFAKQHVVCRLLDPATLQKLGETLGKLSDAELRQD